MPPRLAPLTPAERRLIARLRTPEQVQRWVAKLDYNKEHDGETLRSFRGVHAHKTAHCLEGALAAAFLLEFHGYPPLLLDFESDDKLDHVVFAYRGPDGRWGAVGKSRFPALMGRKPVYRTLRDMAWSYVDPFCDFTGRVKAYGLLNLDELPGPDWRFARGNVWRIEEALIHMPHAPLRAGNLRHRYWRAKYRAFKKEHPHEEPPREFYRGHERFM